MVEVAIVAFAAIVIVAILLGRQLSIRMGQMHATVTSVERAVNHKAASEPTLAEQVDKLVVVTKRTEAKVDGMDTRLTACEHKLCEIAEAS